MPRQQKLVTNNEPTVMMYELRSYTRKRKLPFSLPFVSRRIRRNSQSKQTCIDDLPDEILLKIFRKIPQADIFSGINSVCERWRNLSNDYTLWEKIEVGNNVESKTLHQWFSLASTSLKHFSVKGRNDLNDVLELISKHCKSLETIDVINCWGSDKGPTIHSANLCHLITRCSKLHCIHFDQCQIKSCKFFRLLTKDRKNMSIRKFSYIGPINPKQLGALLHSAKLYQLEETAVLRSNNKIYKLDDITKLLRERDENDHDDVILGIWNAINEQNEINVENVIALEAGQNQ